MALLRRLSSTAKWPGKACMAGAAVLCRHAVHDGAKQGTVPAASAQCPSSWYPPMKGMCHMPPAIYRYKQDHPPTKGVRTRIAHLYNLAYNVTQQTVHNVETPFADATNTDAEQ